MTKPNIAELRSMLAAATPGPWHRLHDKPPTVQADDIGEREDGTIFGLAQPQRRECNCAQVWSHGADCAVAYCATGPDDAPPPETQMANAALLAAAVNALPALLAVAEAANHVVVMLSTKNSAELRDALSKLDFSPPPGEEAR